MKKYLIITKHIKEVSAKDEQEAIEKCNDNNFENDYFEEEIIEEKAEQCQ